MTDDLVIMLLALAIFGVLGFLAGAAAGAYFVRQDRKEGGR